MFQIGRLGKASFRIFHLNINLTKLRETDTKLSGGRSFQAKGTEIWESAQKAGGLVRSLGGGGTVDKMGSDRGESEKQLGKGEVM